MGKEAEVVVHLCVAVQRLLVQSLRTHGGPVLSKKREGREETKDEVRECVVHVLL